MYYGLINSMNRAVVSSYTTRTTAFATATGITDVTILGALNTFDLGLISNGLDTKMKALYPLVGGTASTHKYNFMDARDLDAAFRLQFNGGWVHDSNGVKGNGTNTYMDTFFNNKFNFIDFFKSGIGIYSRTNETGLFIEGNVSDGGVSNTCNFLLYPKYSTLGLIFETQNGAIGAVTDSFGLSTGSSINSSTKSVYKNGVKIGTDTTLLTQTPANKKISLGGATTGGGVGYIGNKQYALSFISEGMTDSDQTNLYTLTQALQTTLSRQV